MKSRILVKAAGFLIFGMMAWGALFPAGVRAGEGGAGELAPAHLYFADPATGFLKSETRHVAQGGGPAAFARNLVEALARGPAGGGSRTLPQDATVLALFLAADGTAWVDLSENAFPEGGGVWSEALAIQSLAATLCMNVPEVKRVRILLAGGQRASAGHLSLDRDYTENLRFIR